MIRLGGHIGASASALVDGQLPSAEADRAWAHVVTCPACHRLVEREGWVKRRLSTLSSQPAPTTAPHDLVGALVDIDAWGALVDLRPTSMRRRATTAIVGVGSVGVAVIGLVALASPPAGGGEVPGTPAPANISGAFTTGGSSTGSVPGVFPVSLSRGSK